MEDQARTIELASQRAVRDLLPGDSFCSSYPPTQRSFLGCWLHIHIKMAGVRTNEDAEGLRETLDAALLAVRDASDPCLDHAEMAQLVGSALQQVYRAYATTNDSAAFADAMVIASLEMDRALEIIPSPSPDLALDRLRRQLAEASAMTRRAVPALSESSPSSHRSASLASIGAPVLLDPPRDVVLPAIPMPPRTLAVELTPEPAAPAAPIVTLDGLDALLATAAPPASIVGPPTPRRRSDAQASRSPTPSEVLSEQAATVIEELGVLGLLRHHEEGETWTGKARVEERLLARLDAIVACGAQVLPELVRKLERRPLPDPELTWALVFVFSSIAGDDMADEAIRLARVSNLALDDVRDAVADAFACAPNVSLEPRLRRWLGSSSPFERVVAIEALGRRGALSAAELGAAARDAELDCVRAAASVLARASGRIDEATLDSLLHHDDERVVRGALLGGVLRAEAASVRRARSLVRSHRGSYAGAAMVHALCEGRRGLETLQEDAAISGSAVALEALGWFGHVSTIPYLIGRLEADDEPTRASAARALARVLGEVSHASQTEDAEGWRAYWKAHGAELDPQLRYRLGAPWGSRVNMRQLRHGLSSPLTRQLAHAELVARIGVAARLDLRAFVARQQEQLAALGEELELKGGSAGGWPVHLHA